ncbi:hypothetical protein L3X38_008865 [Prunus dulcis]|uniref:Reverse transcriptase Ty1/copia-type domain-containing protein n=1 Tax=Prunus dulcis TaxID=3755 RepID=A0AAD5F7J2_PRUDU|nr:hypothetical protein L3X38_008865 [Prunus dulcis]
MAGSGGGELRAPIFNDSKGADESDAKQKEKEESSGAGKMAIAEILMKDAKALGLIQGAVSEEIFPRISHEESSHRAWNILKQEFHGDKQVRSVKLQSLRREFEYTRMREDESLFAYLTKLFDLINQMRGYGEELSRERIVQKMLISLLPVYDPICSVIEHSRDLDVIEVQEIPNQLRPLEIRITSSRRIGRIRGRSGIINLLMELKILANIVGNCIMENVDSRANRNAITVTSLVTLPKTAIVRNLCSSSSFIMLLSCEAAEYSVENELLLEDNEERSVVDTCTQDIDHTPLKYKSLTEIYERCNICIIEPETFEEAIKDAAWQKAMEAELEMIEKNETWELVKRPSDKPIVGVKWIFKVKLNLDGSVQKNKARLVAKDYTQKPRIDFNETFAPVARLDTVRTLIALAAQKRWKLFQLDVKSAFLNGVLHEEVYVDQPPGFVVKDKEDRVYRLKKALYGLKRAPRAWYEEINSYFTAAGFQKSPSEATLYVKAAESGILIVSLYVDDIIYTGSSEELVMSFKTEMMKRYEMTDLDCCTIFWDWV